ncbi:beta strand repeat-containing protein [Candidatus Clostridium stratigraminis]|uniref:Beta strand repeat-containing protein n=1 Tax=Candidatus Clostridium stratigraminis TaxID=3381661 RepID=A0ABW8T527_9CLOT
MNKKKISLALAVTMSLSISIGTNANAASATNIQTGRTQMSDIKVTGVITPDKPTHKNGDTTVNLTGTVTIDGPQLVVKVDGDDNTVVKKISDTKWSYSYVAKLDQNTATDPVFTIEAYTIYVNGKPAGDVHTKATPVTEKVDITPPVITISDYPKDPTNQDITVTVSTNEGTLNATSHTFTDNGSFDFVATDAAGNQTIKTVRINNIDRVAPTAAVNYSTTTPINKDVVATIKPSEPVTYTNIDALPSTIMFDSDASTLTFSKNGSFDLTFADAAGNPGSIRVNVENIDKTSPVGSIEYSETAPTNQDVTVTLNANEPITVTNNGGSLSYTFKENGDFTFEFVDVAGNVGKAMASVSNIDKVAPTATVEYSTQNPTNKDVVVKITPSESVTILNNGGADTYTFTDNGEFTFNFVDAAGNKGTATAVVSNIDRIAPEITIDPFNSTDPTNQDITVYAHTNEGSLNAASHTFTENGKFEFVATDAAGNVTSKTVQVTNIDKVAPVITLGDYNTSPTNKDITVTASTNEGTLNVDSHTFTSNGSFTFTATDAAGNVAEKTVVITNIDKVAPVITLGDYRTDPTNQDITVTATTNEGTLNKDSYTFTENGSYTFTATDAAGNQSSKTVTINNIDKVAPVITTGSYITSLTNKDITVTVSTDKGMLNVTSHTFTENGSFTFTATDEAGNKTDCIIVITNIDKVAPEITLGDYTKDPTNQDITVTAAMNEEGSLNAQSHTFTTNGSFDFVATDLAGNTTTKTVTITNIDKIPPVVTGVINDKYYNIAVTPIFNEGNATLNGAQFTSGTSVSNEGSYTLIVTDTVGNKTTVEFTIDKTPPQLINVTYNSKNQTVTGKAEVGSFVNVSFINNNSNDGATTSVATVQVTNADGSFTIAAKPNKNQSIIVTATDIAGNSTVVNNVPTN